MTREEAIDYLLDPIGKREKHDEAVSMAIEALRNKNDLPISPLLKEPKQGKNGSELFGNTEKLGNGITGETCTDAISRAAVVDMLDEIEAEVAEGYGFQYGKWRKWACELPSAQPVVKDIDVPSTDTISRQAAIDAVDEALTRVFVEHRDIAEKMINKIPSAQPEITLESAIDYLHSIGWMQEHDRILTVERDIPRKPTETTDKAWGLAGKVAVCPNCDYYLGHVGFLTMDDSDHKGNRITYCEHCGQAIDWEGWDEDE